MRKQYYKKHTTFEPQSVKNCLNVFGWTEIRREKKHWQSVCLEEQEEGPIGRTAAAQCPLFQSRATAKGPVSDHGSPLENPFVQMKKLAFGGRN